jgi:aspartyl-tRNA(Asn)/glutamyl-tRNA(Gln) amidotransferase subunit B
MMKTGRGAADIVNERGLIRISSEEQIEAAVEKVFEENPQAVSDAQSDEKAVHFLVGQVMRLTKGRADPVTTNKIVKLNLAKRTGKS